MSAPFKVGDKVTNIRNPENEWSLEMGIVYVVAEVVGSYDGFQTVKLTDTREGFENYNVFKVDRLKKQGKWWKEN